MDLSITVVSTNQRGLIEQHLPSLFDTPANATFEVVLIDNACTDGTGEWVRENLPKVKVIRNENRKSYSANMNIGMCTVTKGRYFVVFNPDIKCLPGMWEEALKFMDENPDVGLIGPQLLNPDMTIQHSCRRFSTPLTLFIRGIHFDGVLKNFKPVYEYLMLDYDHEEVMDVDWVMGAVMIVRREAIDQVGGMDERYKITYSDDQDWCCEMWRGGWRVCLVPQAKAIHDHQRTGMRKPWSKMACVQLINAIKMFQKFSWKLSRSK